MSNQNTSVLRSLVVLRKDGREFYSVGRSIRSVVSYEAALTRVDTDDAMGRFVCYGYGFDAATVVIRSEAASVVNAKVAELRAKGMMSEDEVRAARPRAEKYRALVSTLRTAGLRVTIRNADVDGETKRLTITGDETARDEFMSMCSTEQAQWVKATFVAVEGRDNARSGVISIVD
jgi:hypothetical protein